MKVSWISSWSAFSRSTSSFFSGWNGSRIDLFCPAVCTRRSTPIFLRRAGKPKPADTTPIEPTMEEGSATISSPAIAIM